MCWEDDLIFGSSLDLEGVNPLNMDLMILMEKYFLENNQH